MLDFLRRSVVPVVASSSGKAPLQLTMDSSPPKSLQPVAIFLPSSHVPASSIAKEVPPGPLMQLNGGDDHVRMRQVNGHISLGRIPFTDLVQRIIHDPCFVFVIKSVLLLGHAREIDFRAVRDCLEQTELELSRIVGLAYGQGLDKAFAVSSPWHVCFAAVWQSVEALLKNPTRMQLPQILKCAIETIKNSTRGNISKSRQPIACGPFPGSTGPVGAPNKAKQSRISVPRPALSDQSRAVLLRWFIGHYEHPYPSEEEKKKMVSETGVTLKQVDNFFGNKRMRLKRTAMKLREERGGETPMICGNSKDFSNGLSPSAKWERVVLSELPTYAAAEQLQKATNGRTPNMPKGNRWVIPSEDKDDCTGQEPPSRRRRLG